MNENETYEQLLRIRNKTKNYRAFIHQTLAQLRQLEHRRREDQKEQVPYSRLPPRRRRLDRSARDEALERSDLLKIAAGGVATKAT